MLSVKAREGADTIF